MSRVVGFIHEVKPRGIRLVLLVNEPSAQPLDYTARLVSHRVIHTDCPAREPVLLCDTPVVMFNGI